MTDGTKYICTRRLELSAYDDDGRMIENEYKLVEVGEVWTVVKQEHGNLIAGRGAIHLERGLDWCELTPETLAEHFEEVQA